MAEKYRFTPEADRMARESITEQPSFDTKEEATKHALEKMKKQRIYEVWQGDGKFYVSAPDAWEWMFRKGFKQIYDTGALADMMDTDEIEEV